jgi:septal ring factor EnvC (AmiA/AmiB activator)
VHPRPAQRAQRSSFFANGRDLLPESIYLEPKLQNRVISLFHYAARPEGYIGAGHFGRHELTATKEYLQSVIETQEATNEELQSANEEILSSNEELQSTNEELETAKEELQSTNEELSTVNDELRNRNAEISQVNNDLTNLRQAPIWPFSWWEAISPSAVSLHRLRKYSA